MEADDDNLAQSFFDMLSEEVLSVLRKAAAEAPKAHNGAALIELAATVAHRVGMERRRFAGEALDSYDGAAAEEAPRG